jgi:hypothetical protein
MWGLVSSVRCMGWVVSVCDMGVVCVGGVVVVCGVRCVGGVLSV